MIPDDPTPPAEDFLRAELVCSYLTKNLEIQFQTDADMMDRKTAAIHFAQRTALRVVQSLLLDAAEHAQNNISPK